MTGSRNDDPRIERAEELADQAREDNPDPTTRRETFELGLMDEDLVEEGRDVVVNDGDEDGTG